MEIVGKIIANLDFADQSDLDCAVIKSKQQVKVYLKDIPKLSNALKMVGLDEKLVDRNIDTLSDSENLLIKMLKVLTKKKSIIRVHNYLSKFDYRHQQLLIRIFKKMARSKGMSIIISDFDKNLIFSFADLVLYQQQYYTKNQFVRILDQINRDLWPESALFSYYCNQKFNTNLGYYLDIKELIKGIYRKE